MMSPRSGLFVVVEGIDGAGTTTHSKRLVKTLARAGYDARLTCEPSSGPIGSLIRQVLSHRVIVAGDSGPRGLGWSTMALLFAADRLDHLDSFVLPALADGALVVSDRYDLSSLAYQSVTAPPGVEPMGWIRELNVRAARPDLTLVLDVSPELAAERRKSRGGAEELFEKADVQARLAAVYAHAETIVPSDRVVHLSSEGDADSVAAAVLEVVTRAATERGIRPSPR
ncbi:MAG: dTMP kinase [Polyangiaceae bacterium]|nr:dTMP kinase [Polyangiaceae bacterium]